MTRTQINALGLLMGTVFCAIVSIPTITIGSWVIGVPGIIVDPLVGGILGASVILAVFFGGETCRASMSPRIQWWVLGAINLVFLFFTPATILWKAGFLTGSVLGLHAARFIMRALREEVTCKTR